MPPELNTTPPACPPSRRWIGSALLVLAVVVAGTWLAHAFGLAALTQRAVENLRTLGAPAFFLAMATLPAIGFPLLPFAIAAGPAFAPELGVAGVIGCAVGAVSLNVALSYFVAARLLRGPIQALVRRFGYIVPELDPRHAWLATLLVRVVPGPPFWVQSYALGLLRVPFRAYLVVSTLVPAGYLSAAILLGDAVLQGRPRQALLAAAVFGVAAAGFALTRRWLAHSRPAD
jgi:uncharacterized membrane protein YdjX (TVP38/TMEM64 family)